MAAAWEASSLSIHAASAPSDMRRSSTRRSAVFETSAARSAISSAPIAPRFRSGCRVAQQTDSSIPPSLENFTNKATLGAFNFRIDRDVTDRDRISFYVRSSESRFLVPNDLLQQAAGQRQDRFSGETSAQVHYHRTFDTRTLGSFRFMYRDLAAELWSNPQSTPVRVEQTRGFQETVFVADLTVEGESHTLKFGGDFRYNNVREEFRFGETGEFPDFDVDFRDRQSSGEGSLFVQEQIRWGNFAGSFRSPVRQLRLSHRRRCRQSPRRPELLDPKGRTAASSLLRPCLPAAAN